jgi:hypothetical protein
MSLTLQKGTNEITLEKGVIELSLVKGSAEISLAKNTAEVALTTGGENEIDLMRLPDGIDEIVLQSTDINAHDLSLETQDADIALTGAQAEVALQPPSVEPTLSTGANVINLQLESTISPDSTTDRVIECVCTSAEQVQDCVYVYGIMVGDKIDVRKVDITDSAKIPTIGIVIEKQSTTECTVKICGEIRGLFSGFTPGAQLVVGTDSKPTRPGLLSATAPYFIQVIGVATDTDSLVVQVDQTLNKMII